MDAPPGIPLAGAAGDALARLARATGSAAISSLDGETLLGERAMLMGSTIPGDISAGGGCRLIAAQDDAVALNLARPSDRTLLPALFEDGGLDPEDDAAISRCIAGREATALVERGRMMGLAIAAMHEIHPIVIEPWTLLSTSPPACSPRRGRPRVLDLSALWAGPLAAHLLWLAGSDVIKVESTTRPEAMRGSQPDFYALLNQGKASVALDLRNPADRQMLLTLIADVDIVIEAARPRALEQLGIDARAIVATTPGLAWLTITAHGATGDAAHWVGFGDDVGVAAGLSAEIYAATGQIGFVGDAIADPLTGVHTAVLGWELWQRREGGRYGIAMRDVAAACLQRERDRDPRLWRQSLIRWVAGRGLPFPQVRRRDSAAASPPSSGTPSWQKAAARC